MGWDSRLIYPPNADRRVTVRATSLQIVVWGDAARRQNKPLGAFIGCAGDFTAAYFSQEGLQERHRQQHLILPRFEGEQRLRRLLHAGWHGLDHLLPPRGSAV